MISPLSGTLSPLGRSRPAPVAAPPAGGPPPVAGYRLWLAADAITGLSDGDPVATWADGSGNGHNAAQATTANRPTYRAAVVNGRPVVRYDGTNDSLSIPSAPTLRTVFAVVRWTAYAGRGYACPLSHSTDKAMAISNGTAALYADGAFDMARGAARYYVNGVQTVALPAAGGWAVVTAARDADIASGGTLYVGHQQGAVGGWHWHYGDIAEVIVYPTVLSDADRGSVGSYLSTKYGL